MRHNLGHSTVHPWFAWSLNYYHIIYFFWYFYLLSPYFDPIVMDSERNPGQKRNTSKYQHEITKVHKYLFHKYVSTFLYICVKEKHFRPFWSKNRSFLVRKTIWRADPLPPWCNRPKWIRSYKSTAWARWYLFFAIKPLYNKLRPYRGVIFSHFLVFKVNIRVPI